MENKCLLIQEAITAVNSKTKNSRITNQKISLGKIIFTRDDGYFFESISFESCEWRPFLRYETGFIELQNLTKKKSPLIIIKKYDIQS